MTNAQLKPKPQILNSEIWTLGFGHYLDIGNWKLGIIVLFVLICSNND